MELSAQLYFQHATHDVVVRYLRSRLGDLSAQESDSITLVSGAHDGARPLLGDLVYR
jgi:hypothetical protein